MRLIALELENFRQYAHAHIAFEPGITAIVGANGSGKTTLVEAVLWALYGTRVIREGTETLRFLWSPGGAKVRVVLEFELGNRRYRIRRTPTEAELVQLDTRGGWQPLARGTTAVNDQVLRLLGMNHLQFQTSFCARQKELEFMAYSPQKRREEISRMLGYERITEAIDQATLAVRALQAEVEGLRKTIGDPQAVQQQLQEAEASLQQVEHNLRNAEEQLADATLRYQAARAEFEAQQTLREQYLDLCRQRDLLQNDCQHIEARLNELRQRWEMLKVAHGRYKAIEPEARRYRELQKELAELERLAQAERERTQLQARYDALHQHQQQLHAERTELLHKRTALKQLEPRLRQAEQLHKQIQQLRQVAQRAAERAQIEAQLQTYQQQVEALRQKEPTRTDLQHAIQRAEQQLNAQKDAHKRTEQQLTALLEQWNTQRAEVSAQIRAEEHNLKQLHARLEQLQALGEQGTCPTCGQPLSEGYHQVLEHTSAEATRTEQHLHHLRQLLHALQTEPTEAQALRTQLEQLRQACDSLQHQLAHLQAQQQQLDQELLQIPRLEAQIRQLERQLQRIPVYDPQEEQRLQAMLDELQPDVERARQLQGELRRLHTVERELQNIAHELANLHAQLTALPTGYDATRHEAARAEAERLRPIYEEALQLHSTLQQRKELLEQIERTKEALQEKTAALQQVEQQIAQLGYSEAVYQQVAQTYAEVEQFLNALAQTVSDLRSERARYAALRDHLRQQLEQIEQQQRLLQEKERELLTHQTLRKALQDFRTELNTRLRPMLAALATEFLSTLTNGRYTELDLDEEYRFTVIDEGHRKAVISGGEEDIVNLSLRLALARMIAERAGQPLSLLILDEVFASLDAERRQSVMQLLNNLRNWFDQILVISHFEEINEAADRCLRVRRNPLTRASEIVDQELPSSALLDAESPL
ncbi:MAG: SMC family ATPase [Armatimonadota bacterium]|nr:SMC family ATPase [Armatimonadota bacterium]